MNHLARHCFAACALVGLVALAPASAQEFRLGFVNTDRVFKEALPARTAQDKLAQEFSKTEKELADREAELKSLQGSFEREAPTLPAEQRAARQRQLLEMDRDHQRRRRAFQEDLNARKNEEFQQILERANKVVRQIAKAESYDLILQDAVYVNPQHDITDQVIKALDLEAAK